VPLKFFFVKYLVAVTARVTVTGVTGRVTGTVTGTVAVTGVGGVVFSFIELDDGFDHVCFSGLFKFDVVGSTIIKELLNFEF